MSREKLGEFLESYTEGSTTTPGKISYTNRDRDGQGLDPGVDDLGIDPGSGRPLLQHNSKGPQGISLVNDFLSFLTNHAPNYYKLKQGATTAQSVKHLTEDGSPVVLKAAENTSAENVFVKTAESAGDGLGATMSQYSNSGYLDGLNNIVSKLGDITDPSMDEGPGPHSGNKLLTSIEGQDQNVTGKTFVDTTVDDLEQNSLNAVQGMLQERNRFNTSQERAFAPYDNSQLSKNMKTGKDGQGSRTAQSEYGSFVKSAPEMVNNDLAHVGRSMILQALGIDWSDSPGGATNPNEFEYDTESVIVNGAAMVLNTPTSVQFPRAKNAYGAPVVGDGVDSSPLSEGAFETDGESHSYGGHYTPDLAYSSPKSRAVLRARAAAVIIGMVIATKTVSDSLDIAYSTIELGRSHGKLGEAKRFAANAKTQVFQRLVIPVTRFPYSDCLNMGLTMLFGTSDMSFDKIKNVSNHQTISEAPGFWYAIGKSMLQKFAAASTSLTKNLESFESDPVGSSTAILADVTRSGIVGVINSIVQIGDIGLFSTGGTANLQNAANGGVRPWNVDSLVEGPQTRISKSRVNTNGQTSAALAWRGMSAPSLYLLPRNVIKAVVDSNTLNWGPNPIKAHTATSLIEKSYIDVNGYGPTAGISRGRIPTDVRRKMENTLDAEYVPFYFHDVRTNEMIGFHAFLTNLSDSFSPQFSSNKGYGRIDPVYIYKDTKRTVTFSFYVAATSKEDFDEMWFKINKLTTLVYPQWSKGSGLVDGDDNKIVQPFSQVIGATPLVRLRIGDVIRGNYSRFNLGRMFGIGTDEFKIADNTFGLGGGSSGFVNMTAPWTTAVSDFMIDYIFSTAYGSPMALLPFSGDAGASVADKLVRSVVGTGMEALGGSGIVNPIGAALILGELSNPDSDEAIADSLGTSNVVLDGVAALASKIATGRAKSNLGTGGGYTGTSFPFLKPSSNIGYTLVTESGETKLRTTIPYRVAVKDKKKVAINSIKNANSAYVSKGLEKQNHMKTRYEVQFFDLDAPKVDGKLYVWHEDLMPNPDMLFMVRVSLLLDPVATVAGLGQMVVNETASKYMGFPADALNIFTTDAAEFMHPANNPITRAFENSGGRGLAGVLQSLSYDWYDNTIPWETEWGSRAPMMAKVSVTFDVIHDLPPGIDSSGYNRAPVYNVGRTMNAISGDENPDHGQGSRQSYTRAGIKAVQKLKKE